MLLFGIWVQRLGDLSVALGILAAGLAFALQEVIGSVADLRRSFRSEISQRLLSEFEAEGIVIASQTIAIVQFPSNSASEESAG